MKQNSSEVDLQDSYILNIRLGSFNNLKYRPLNSCIFRKFKIDFHIHIS